jgi:hypothetical protein
MLQPRAKWKQPQIIIFCLSPRVAHLIAAFISFSPREFFSSSRACKKAAESAEARLRHEIENNLSLRLLVTIEHLVGPLHLMCSAEDWEQQMRHSRCVQDPSNSRRRRLLSIFAEETRAGVIYLCAERSFADCSSRLRQRAHPLGGRF